jgi:hypothetical protein
MMALFSVQRLGTIHDFAMLTRSRNSPHARGSQHRFLECSLSDCREFKRFTLELPLLSCP